MTRYFEKNFLTDDALDIEGIENVLWETFHTLSHNVELKVAEPFIRRKYVEGREQELDKSLAGTALMMIASCEALLSKLDPGTVEAAVEEIGRRLDKDPRDEFGDLLRAVLGIE